MVLNPIRIFQGSFGGPTLYQNPHYVSPNMVGIFLLPQSAAYFQQFWCHSCSNHYTEIKSIALRYSTVEPRYNAVVGVYDFGPRCTRGTLVVPISATRELLNSCDRHPLHQVQERC